LRADLLDETGQLDNLIVRELGDIFNSRSGAIGAADKQQSGECPRGYGRQAEGAQRPRQAREELGTQRPIG
jgi:hypothetical protein